MDRDVSLRLVNYITESDDDGGSDSRATSPRSSEIGGDVGSRLGQAAALRRSTTALLSPTAIHMSGGIALHKYLLGSRSVVRIWSSL